MSQLNEILATIEARAEKATPGYLCTQNGEVFSRRCWRGVPVRAMKQDLNSHGYLRVRLTIDGKRKTFLVHTLVARIYVGDKPSALHEVCHIDGNRQNNVVSNLKWGTRKENAADRTKHGNCKAAENGKKSAWKLKKEYRKSLVK